MDAGVALFLVVKRLSASEIGWFGHLTGVPDRRACGRHPESILTELTQSNRLSGMAEALLALGSRLEKPPHAAARATLRSAFHAQDLRRVVTGIGRGGATFDVAHSPQWLR